MDSKHLKLPKNRLQSFFDCILHKTSHFLLVGLTIFLFAIPLLIISGITNILVYEIKLQLAQNIITIEAANRRLFETFTASNFLLVPSFVLLFIGLAGVLHVTRRMIFQEHVSFFDDFKTGLKSNTLTFALIGLLLGVLYAVMMTLARSGLVMPKSTMLDITFAISIAAFVLALLMAPFMLLQTDLYNLSLKDKFKNSFLLGMRTALTTLPLLILVFSPWLLLLINYDGVTFFIVLALLLLIATPLALLAIHEYGLHILDKYINKIHHPSIYRKGIFSDAKD